MSKKVAISLGDGMFGGPPCHTPKYACAGKGLKPGTETSAIYFRNGHGRTTIIGYEGHAQQNGILSKSSCPHFMILGQS